MTAASPRVAVIGCGLVGAAVARELQLCGAQAVVHEAGAPGGGTSGTTFAWVNSYEKEPRAYHELNVAGIRAHAELHELGSPVAQWFFPTGNLIWADGADGEARLARAIGRLESWDYPVHRLTRRAVLALEPDLRVADRAAEIVFLPLEGYVLPALLLARLLGEALDLGAELRCPARVESIALGPAGVRLRLSDGSSDVFDAAVSCAGRWSGELLAGAGYSLPMVDHKTPGSPAVGYLAYTAPAPVRLSRVLTTPRLNVRPDGGGRLVLQALELDQTADPAEVAEPRGPIGRELGRRLSELLRGGERAEVEAIRVGQRSLPADGLTVAGHVDDNGRLYVVATHSGVTLAPLLARLAAEEVVGGTRAQALAPFRPQRFSQGSDLRV